MTLEERLQRLEDIRAIEALKWRYLRACDRKDPETVRDCFTPDATIEYEGFPPFSNRDDFVAIYRQFGCQPHIIDMHHGQNPHVTLTGPDTATGLFDLFFFQIDTEARRHTQLAIAYDDTFIRRDGRWWIARTTCRRISMLVQNIDSEGAPSVAFAGRSDTD